MLKDRIAGAVLLALSGGYYWMASTINRSQLSDVVGASAFPMALAVVLAVLSCVLMMSGVLKKAPASSAEERAAVVAKDLHGFARAGGTLAIGIGFLVIIPYAGYIIAVAMLLLATLLYFHERLSWGIVLVSVAGALILWLMFRAIFEIPVPPGVWPDLIKILFHK
jgi:hypothetical protein